MILSWGAIGKARASTGISALGRRGCPLRRYARLVGAPNCAPSLRSVAGLLLALALESAYEDTLASLDGSLTARAAQSRARKLSASNGGRLGPPRRPATRHRSRAVRPDRRECRRLSERDPSKPSRRRRAKRARPFMSHEKEGVGVLVGDVQRATRRPATERSEGALLGAPPERASSTKRIPAPD